MGVDKVSLNLRSGKNTSGAAIAIAAAAAVLMPLPSKIILFSMVHNFLFY